MCDRKAGRIYADIDLTCVMKTPRNTRKYNFNNLTYEHTINGIIDTFEEIDSFSKNL